MKMKSRSSRQRGGKMRLDIKTLEMWAAIALALAAFVIVLKLALL